MAAASTQEINDAGPAVCAAPGARSSQPDPMIEPSETNINPQKPIVLRKCGLPPEGGADDSETAMMTSLPARNGPPEERSALSAGYWPDHGPVRLRSPEAVGNRWLNLHFRRPEAAVPIVNNLQHFSKGDVFEGLAARCVTLSEGRD